MKKWITQPISRTCQCDYGRCGQPTTHAYPAMGMGWASCCEKHVQKHKDYAKPIAELLANGETLKDA